MPDTPFPWKEWGGQPPAQGVHGARKSWGGVANSQPLGLWELFLEANDNLMGRKTWVVLKFQHNIPPHTHNGAKGSGFSRGH